MDIFKLSVPWLNNLFQNWMINKYLSLYDSQISSIVDDVVRKEKY